MRNSLIRYATLLIYLFFSSSIWAVESELWQQFVNAKSIGEEPT